MPPRKQATVAKTATSANVTKAVEAATSTNTRSKPAVTTTGSRAATSISSAKAPRAPTSKDAVSKNAKRKARDIVHVEEEVEEDLFPNDMPASDEDDDIQDAEQQLSSGDEGDLADFASHDEDDDESDDGDKDESDEDEDEEEDDGEEGDGDDEDEESDIEDMFDSDNELEKATKQQSIGFECISGVFQPFHSFVRSFVTYSRLCSVSDCFRCASNQTLAPKSAHRRRQHL